MGCTLTLSCGRSYALSRTCTSSILPLWLLHHWYFLLALVCLGSPLWHLAHQWPFFLQSLHVNFFQGSWLCLVHVYECNCHMAWCFFCQMTQCLFQNFWGFLLVLVHGGQDWLAFDCINLYIFHVTIPYHVCCSIPHSIEYLTGSCVIFIHGSLSSSMYNCISESGRA